MLTVSVRIRKPEPTQTRWGVVVLHKVVFCKWLSPLRLRCFTLLLNVTCSERLSGHLLKQLHRQLCIMSISMFPYSDSWRSLSLIPLHSSNPSLVLFSNHLSHWWWGPGYLYRPVHPQAAIFMLTKTVDWWLICSCLTVIVFHDFTWETNESKAVHLAIV